MQDIINSFKILIMPNKTFSHYKNLKKDRNLNITFTLCTSFILCVFAILVIFLTNTQNTNEPIIVVLFLIMGFLLINVVLIFIQIINSLILKLAAKLLKVQLSFKSIRDIVALTLTPYLLASLINSSWLIFYNQHPPTSLLYFFNTTNDKLSNILSTFDLFVIFQIILMGIGFNIYTDSKNKLKGYCFVPLIFVLIYSIVILII